MSIVDDVIAFEPGQTYRANLAGAWQTYKIHIVSVINEGMSPFPMVVYRYFGSSKQWWHYQIQSAYLLTGEIRQWEKNGDFKVHM